MKSKTVLHGTIRMKRTNAAFIKRYQSFDQGVKKVKSDKRERRMKMGSVLRQRITSMRERNSSQIRDVKKTERDHYEKP